MNVFRGTTDFLRMDCGTDKTDACVMQDKNCSIAFYFVLNLVRNQVESINNQNSLDLLRQTLIHPLRWGKWKLVEKRPYAKQLK